MSRNGFLTFSHRVKQQVLQTWEDAGVSPSGERREGETGQRIHSQQRHMMMMQLTAQFHTVGRSKTQYCVLLYTL